jgi:hypothetical protein
VRGAERTSATRPDGGRSARARRGRGPGHGVESIRRPDGEALHHVDAAHGVIRSPFLELVALLPRAPYQRSRPPVLSACVLCLSWRARVERLFASWTGEDPPRSQPGRNGVREHPSEPGIPEVADFMSPAARLRVRSRSYYINRRRSLRTKARAIAASTPRTGSPRVPPRIGRAGAGAGTPRSRKPRERPATTSGRSPPPFPTTQTRGLTLRAG